MTNIALNKVSLNLGGSRVLQVANRSNTQMMSYLIETVTGKLIMIDGGYYIDPDAHHLYELLCQKGKVVDLWIITHAHEDHFGALSRMLELYTSFDIEIKKMCFDFPPLPWLSKVERGHSYPYIVNFLNQLNNHHIPVTEIHKGDILRIDEVELEILHDAQNYERYMGINNTSLVIRAKFPGNDILFLGDIGSRGGDDLLSDCPREKLNCEVVQMAHHGQGAVKKNFYEVVRPKVCLYTAPLWLWENDNGNGPGSGPWETLETRKWMEELGRELDCPMAYGDFLFD